MKLTINDVIKACNGELLIGDINLELTEFSKDTRTIQNGDTYIGISGENFDGNIFYQQAIENGAIACILEKTIKNIIDLTKIKNTTIILVENSIEALKNLAEHKLSYYNIPVVAVTGSVGKTSTRDIIYSIMKTTYNVLKTEGNFNNEIGLPLTILKLKDHNALILEMGMNNLNEISYLSKIAKPDIAVITNIAPAHIGILGSMENILKAKLEIIDGLKKDGILIYNNDNEYLHNANITVNKTTCGIINASDVQAKNIKFNESGSTFTVQTKDKEFEIKASLYSNNYIENCLLAIAVGLKLGITVDNIQTGVEKFIITGGRLEAIKLNNNITLINDAYNASVNSMKNAIDFIINTSPNRKIVILGDMFELGEFSVKLHSEVGKYISNKNIDYLITIGNDSKNISDNAIENGFDNNKVKHFDTKEESYEYLDILIKPEDTIIVKASNGMKFKEIIEHLKEKYQ